MSETKAPTTRVPREKTEADWISEQADREEEKLRKLPVYQELLEKSKGDRTFGGMADFFKKRERILQDLRVQEYAEIEALIKAQRRGPFGF
jgi:hypothetical protein